MNPDSWDGLRLKYAVRLVNEDASPDAPYVGLEQVDSWTGQYVTVEGEDPSGRAFREGDVMFGKLRPYLAKSFLAVSSGNCSSELLVLRPNDNASAQFLKFSFLNPEFIDLVNSSTFGAKMPRANWDFIGNVPIWLPPLTIQKAIADYLDEKTAAIDALIEKKRKLLDLLAEERAALINQAVTKGLDPTVPMKDSGIPWIGEIPAHWEVRPLGYFVALAGGSTPSKANSDYWNGDVAWISPKDMKRFYIAGSLDHVTERAVQETSLSRLESGVTLVVVRGMILARTFPVALTTAEVTINQDMKALRPERLFNSEYLAWQLQARALEVKSLVEEAGHGTRVLRTDLFTKLPLLVPPRTVQAEIVDAVRRIAKQADLRQTALETQLLRLQEYRQALITAAVTGQLDIGVAA